MKPKTIKLTAYRLKGSENAKAPIPSPASRKWMDETRDRFAYRCLPMVIGNQAGWTILNSVGFEAQWDGSDRPGGVKILFDDLVSAKLVDGHFGFGILTWRMPYLFRTSKGYNILARGPANMPKDGISALEGLVETDWAVATFTMNWKFTRANYPVRFEAGEPYCMIVPQRRGELESCAPTIEDIEIEPHTEEGNKQWSRSRDTFLSSQKMSTGNSWQKHYMKGTSPGRPGAFPEHQSSLQLGEFKENQKKSVLLT